MKKLFENWRKFEKDILSELDVGPGGGLQTHAAAQAKDPELYQKSSKVNIHKHPALMMATNWARIIASIGDPTGITGWPDVVSAYNESKDAKNELAKALKDVPQVPDKIASAEHRVARADAFLFVMIMAIAPLWAGKAPKIAFVLTKAANGLRFLLKSAKRGEDFSGIAMMLTRVLDLFDDFIAKKYPKLAPKPPKSVGRPGEKVASPHADDELVRVRDKILNDLRGASKRPGGTRPDLPVSRSGQEKTRSMRARSGD